jgi:S-adenosylmethionine synthetase
VNRDFIFTSESVTEGHPDKLCDQISDALVDRFLQQDPRSLVIAESAVATGIVFVALRFASEANVDITNTVRGVIRDVGYEYEGFDARTCTVMVNAREISADQRPPDERQLDDEAIERITVSDQVTLFGYACRHTPALMPLPIWLAHKLARQLAEVRRSGRLPYLAPDGKTQVAVEFRRRRPARIHGITLVSSQLTSHPDADKLEQDLRELVLAPVFEEEELKPDSRTRIFVNPGETLALGGPAVHAGLTGRKTAVDTYGEYARHSGAALSGKDPGRIDRIGAYAARHAAKCVVAADLADECEVQLSYSIGLPRPVSVQVETWGTGRVPDGILGERVCACFDFRLAGIVRAFDLRGQPAAHAAAFYRKLAAYGHMGRVDGDWPWESVNDADALR